MFVENKGSSGTWWTKMNAEIYKIKSEEREPGDWTCTVLHIICWCCHPLRYIIWESQIALILLKPLVGRFSWYSNSISVNWCPTTQKILFPRGYFNKIFLFWVSLGWRLFAVDPECYFMYSQLQTSQCLRETTRKLPFLETAPAFSLSAPFTLPSTPSVQAQLKPQLLPCYITCGYHILAN